MSLPNADLEELMLGLPRFATCPTCGELHRVFNTNTAQIMGEKRCCWAHNEHIVAMAALRRAARNEQRYTRVPLTDNPADGTVLCNYCGQYEGHHTTVCARMYNDPD